jgi:hypothetical protein
MRRLIDLIEKPKVEFDVLCSLSESMGENDWRAWITADGEVHEVIGDVTHAEYSMHHFPADPDDEDYSIERFNVDAAFDKALEAGWIRVGINLISFEFFATCHTTVTRPALVALLRLLEIHYADSFMLDFAGKMIYAKSTKGMQAQIAKLMRHLNV